MGTIGDSETKVPAVLVGLGHLGRELGAIVLRLEDRFEVVGAVDPAHAGVDLGELVPEARGAEIVIAADPGAAFSAGKGGVAFVVASSDLEALVPTLEAAARAGVNVVSTCETLAFPGVTSPEIEAHLEEAFLAGGVTCLGTGVNPGFVLDRLPVVLSSVVGPVHHAFARRVVDIATRRPGLQRKVGAGLDPDAFADLAEAGEVGHVGLVESAVLLALGVGFEVDELDETIDPILAEAPFDTGFVRGEAGTVAGSRQTARCFESGREVVRLELVMAAFAENPRDEVRLDADPKVSLVVEGGVAGDRATLWSLLHAAAPVIRAEPGLMTVLDLPAAP